MIRKAEQVKTYVDETTLREKLELLALERELNQSFGSTQSEDETDIFLEMMGDKEITEEDIEYYNKILQNYGKKLIPIRSTAELQKIGADENYPLDGLYVLLQDISLQGQNWSPIGTGDSPFLGIFNGNNKTIDELTISNVDMNAGLFGVNDGSIKNIQLTNVSVVSEHTMVGGISGQNNGLIENCKIQSGTISGSGNDILENDSGAFGTTAGGSRVGGICGQNNDGGIIQNCTNASAVTAEYRLVGGICGYNIGGDIYNCENTGAISGTLQIGGITGDAQGVDANNISYLRDSKNYGTITQNAGTERPNQAETGGIVGTSYTYSVVENCYNEGIVSAKGYAHGGIIGWNFYIVKNCKNQGEINNSKTSYIEGVAGIVGYNTGNIYNCENAGDVYVSSDLALYTGGIAGYTYRSPSAILDEFIIKECINSGNVTGATCVGGITGRLNVGNIVSSYNVGNIQGVQRVGGIAGDSNSEALKIENVYNKGSITATTNYVGGIAGRLNIGTIVNAYNTGTITLSSSNTSTGGVIGSVNTTDVDVTQDIKNCYYLDSSCANAIGDISTTIATVASKTSDEMKTLADLLGTGFKNSTDGDGYPKLAWE